MGAQINVINGIKERENGMNMCKERLPATFQRACAANNFKSAEKKGGGGNVNVNFRIQSTSAVIYTRTVKECHLVLTEIKGSLLFYVKENEGHVERLH
jgi:hypothetical protein